MSSPILVGREAETRAFETALQEARDGHPGVIVLGGEAGVGKTRLIAEFAARTREMGGTAVVGAATPSVGTSRTPFAALTPVLRGLIRSMDARLLDRMLGDARRDLAALLPELGPAARAPEEPEPFTAARLSESVLVAIEAAAHLRPPLFVAFDDMHWADDATRGIVTYVSRNLVDVGVVTLVTYRSDAVHGHEPTMAFIAELTRVSGAERLDLGPLSPDDVSRQVRAILGADPAAEVLRALVRRSSGNPFFVEELVSSVVQGGVERLPPSVRTIVEAKMARLSPAARALVEAAALCGPDVPVLLLAMAVPMPPGDFDGAMREAVDADLLVPWSAVPRSSVEGSADPIERMVVRHVLVGEVIQAGLSAPRRRELHLALAAAIEARPAMSGATELERTSRLSTHLLSAGETRRAVPALLGMAAAADDARAFVSADEAYGRALAAWRDLGPAAPSLGIDRTSVLERAARAASLSGDARRAVALAEEADPGDHGQAGSADVEQALRMRFHLGTYLAQAGDHERAVHTLRETADAAPDGSLLRARCLTALARELVILHHREDAARLAHDAATIAERLGADREAQGARAVEALALARLGRIDDALTVVQAASRSAQAGRRPGPTASRPSRFAAEIQAYLDRATVLERSGDASAAARAALEGDEAATRHGLSGTLGPLMRAVAARSLLRTGAWDEASTLVEMPEGVVLRGAQARAAALVRALLATWRGDWEGAERDLEVARSEVVVDELPGWASFGYLVEAEVAAARRRYSDARASLARGIAVSEAEDDRLGAAQLAVLALRVEADAAEAADVRGAAQEVAPAVELATGYLVRLRALRSSPSIRHGPAAVEAALLATGEAEMARLTRGADAASRWGQAIDAWAQVGDAYMGALARMRLADVLIADAASRAAAAEPLRGALRTADALGALPLARSIEALARRARLRAVLVDLPKARGDEPPGVGEARRLGLSDREIDVLALVANGLSDREIGARLFITTKTVGHHVSHILDKLGVERRGEAAAVAFRIGLTGEPA